MCTSNSDTTWDERDSADLIQNKTAPLRDYRVPAELYLIHHLTVHLKSCESSCQYDQAHFSSFCGSNTKAIFIPSGIIAENYSRKIWALRELTKVINNVQQKKIFLSEHKLNIQWLRW